MLEILLKDNKKINLKAILYIVKSGSEFSRRINLYFNGTEFTKNFFDRKSVKEFIKFLKYYDIPITLIKCNYNCSYMDLPF